MTQARVSELSLTPVKGTRLSHPEAVDVDATGLRDDRLFHVVLAERDRQLGATRAALAPIESAWDRATERLTLRLPGGRVVEDRVELGRELDARVSWNGWAPLPGREVLGPWSSALSEQLGERASLGMTTAPGRAIDVAPVTLVSTASIARLERELGKAGLGARRFRMNLVLDGAGEHEEDSWYGRRLTVGGCVLRVTGPVPRCVTVTRDPATGVRDADVLRAIVGYRAAIPAPGTGEPVEAPFGVYAQVERGGRIAAGDRVGLLPA
jgi:uncharacterized protein YcbX